MSTEARFSLVFKKRRAVISVENQNNEPLFLGLEDWRNPESHAVTANTGVYTLTIELDKDFLPDLHEFDEFNVFEELSLTTAFRAGNGTLEISDLYATALRDTEMERADFDQEFGRAMRALFLDFLQMTPEEMRHIFDLIKGA